MERIATSSLARGLIGGSVNCATRIWVIGQPGAGKTTVSSDLALALRLTHYELDRHYWGPEWRAFSGEQFADDVARIVQKDSWIVDGSYADAATLVGARATCLVWVDIPFHGSLWRLIRRTYLRLIRKEVLWSNNVESWRNILLKRDGIVYYALRTYRERERFLNKTWEEFLGEKIKVNSSGELLSAMARLKQIRHAEESAVTATRTGEDYRT